MDKFRSCLNKSDTNRIVMKNFWQQQDKSYCNEKFLAAVKQIVVLKNAPVAALRRCAKKRCLDSGHIRSYC